MTCIVNSTHLTDVVFGLLSDFRMYDVHELSLILSVVKGTIRIHSSLTHRFENIYNKAMV